MGCDCDSISFIVKTIILLRNEIMRTAFLIMRIGQNMEFLKHRMSMLISKNWKQIGLLGILVIQ